MRLVFPNAHRLNRGNYVVKELAAACRANDITDLVVLHEHRGVPDALILSHFPHGPTVYFTLHNVSLRHDLPAAARGTVSEAYPHLVFADFSSALGARVRDILKYCFPVPKEDSKRVMTFANDGDFISFRCDHNCCVPLWLTATRHHVFVKTSHKEVQLAEVGPRFEMKRKLDLSLTSVAHVLRSVRDTAGDSRAGGGGPRVDPLALLAHRKEAAISLILECVEKYLNVILVRSPLALLLARCPYTGGLLASPSASFPSLTFLGSKMPISATNHRRKTKALSLRAGSVTGAGRLAR